VEIETWELLYETGKKGRRTGLGFTALADTMAALGYKFDSEEAIAEIEKIAKEKCKAEFDSSIDMAIERGPFEVFDTKYELKSGFTAMLENELPEVYHRMMQHGRRNISISTVAPTGTLSILAQTSSGIEPVFLLSYKRRRKVNANDKKAKIDFVDELGDCWEEFTVYHRKLKQWMEITGETDINKSPYAGATAGEIDWKQRIRIQSVVQKYVTHSISSTINLPADTTVDRVADIYIEAWKQGLKGITVYRDGSRSGVLVAEDDNKKKEAKNTEIVETIPPKRPHKLEAKVVRFNNNHEKWIAVVGVLNNRPYEIFTGRAEDSFYLPEWVNVGWVLKNKNENGDTRYDFQYIDKEGYRVTIEGLSRSFNKEYWNYAKLISGVLRHGMPIPDVVELINDLNLYDDSINTWKKGVARALKMFIPNGTVAGDKSCSECGDSEGLIYEEGCLKCKSCGYTKCG
jgi:ribonucleoside-diphosphate reductase alpha chain